MKCQITFSLKIMKNITNLLSGHLAHSDDNNYDLKMLTS